MYILNSCGGISCFSRFEKRAESRTDLILHLFENTVKDAVISAPDEICIFVVLRVCRTP